VVTRSSSRGDLVRAAIAYRGTPYVYGGAGRDGFDCSGFTSYLYGRLGISLPHSARGQFEMGRHISRDAMKPGDLVFFHTVTPGISHVGVYIGNGRFIHASSRRSGGVRVDNLDRDYYQSAFRGARRVR
jgi:cell wall-associated NlpC family hydrolase